MGNLSAASITEKDVGTADAKISDDKAGDTLYWAVRESAYTDADVDAIKSGSGATDFGNLVSELGENAVSATGLPYETPMNFGFVSEAAVAPPLPDGDNFLVWTEDFEQTEWNLNKSVVTSTGQVGPTSSNASLITDDGVSASGVVEVEQQTFSLPAGTYTCSVSAKAGKCSSLVIYTANSETGDGGTRFNLETGEVTAPHPNHFDHGMLAEANDYWRCYVSITTTVTKNVKWAFRGSKDTTDWISPNGTWTYSITQAQVNTGALTAYLKVEGS